MPASSPLRSPLERAMRQTLAHLDSLAAAPVGASATLESLRARLAKPLNGGRLAADAVFDELVADWVARHEAQRRAMSVLAAS